MVKHSQEYNLFNDRVCHMKDFLDSLKKFRELDGFEAHDLEELYLSYANFIDFIFSDLEVNSEEE